MPADDSPPDAPSPLTGAGALGDPYIGHVPDPEMPWPFLRRTGLIWPMYARVSDQPASDDSDDSDAPMVAGIDFDQSEYSDEESESSAQETAESGEDEPRPLPEFEDDEGEIQDEDRLPSAASSVVPLVDSESGADTLDPADDFFVREDGVARRRRCFCPPSQWDAMRVLTNDGGEIIIARTSLMYNSDVFYALLTLPGSPDDRTFPVDDSFEDFNTLAELFVFDQVDAWRVSIQPRKVRRGNPFKVDPAYEAHLDAQLAHARRLRILMDKYHCLAVWPTFSAHLESLLQRRYPPSAWKVLAFANDQRLWRLAQLAIRYLGIHHHEGTPVLPDEMPDEVIRDLGTEGFIAYKRACDKSGNRCRHEVDGYLFWWDQVAKEYRIPRREG